MLQLEYIRPQNNELITIEFEASIKQFKNKNRVTFWTANGAEGSVASLSLRHTSNISNNNEILIENYVSRNPTLYAHSPTPDCPAIVKNNFKIIIINM